MLTVLLVFIFFILGLFISAIVTRLHIRTDVIGELTIIEQEDNENSLLLGIYSGKTGEIVEGRVVKLLVTRD